MSDEQFNRIVFCVCFVITATLLYLTIRSVNSKNMEKTTVQNIREYKLTFPSNVVNSRAERSL